MAWIESHQELGRHPKTARLARLLGVSLPQVIGHLHLLWWWALDFALDGDLTGLDAIDIAEAARWDGDPQLFLDALLTCGRNGEPGFLERTEDGRLLIHDWWDYAGKLVERRQTDAERKRRARMSTGRPPDIQRTSAGRPLDVQRNSTVPNHTTNHDDDTAPAREESEPPDHRAECLALINRTRPDWVLSGDRYREFLSYEDRLPWDVIRTAVDKTLAAGTRDLNYCLAILERYVEANVQTVADVEALDAEHERLKQQRARDAPRGRGGRQPPSGSNVILRRGSTERRYDNVFRRFDDGGGAHDTG